MTTFFDFDCKTYKVCHFGQSHFGQIRFSMNSDFGKNPDMST